MRSHHESIKATLSDIVAAMSESSMLSRKTPKKTLQERENYPLIPC
jgi:hypothetical protein